MNEEQEREVELRVRERLNDERFKRLEGYSRWSTRAMIGVSVAIWAFICVDMLVTCEARRIVREELHK